MIRRELPQQQWAFLSQVDHARIAGEMAAAWGNPQLRGIDLPDRLIPAIIHHDHGWIEWDSSPEIDPANGKPRDFLEMEMQDSTRIWSESIDFCADSSQNPLASPEGGIWVSRHFCFLARLAADHRKAASDPIAQKEFQLLQDFLDQQHQLQTSLASKLGLSLESILLDEGFHWVQTFDRLSLWLCCAERTESQQLDFPSGLSLRLTPAETTAIEIEPWPFSVSNLVLTVQAAVLQQQRFASDEQFRQKLRGADKQPLTWRLSPAQ